MSPELQAALSQLLMAALSVGSTALAALAVLGAQWLKAKKDVVRTQIGSNNWALLEQIARAAVKEAQQRGLDKSGAEKLNMALGSAATIAQAHGISVTQEMMRTVIEAAIRDKVHLSPTFLDAKPIDWNALANTYIPGTSDK